MRILVVEDEKHLNRIISEAVEDEGYSVDSCYNGVEALEYLACADYDVIILDIMMPCMKSDALSARKPPSRVYSSTNAAPTIIMDT